MKVNLTLCLTQKAKTFTEVEHVEVKLREEKLEQQPLLPSHSFTHPEVEEWQVDLENLMLR